jgi:arylsulfatase A
MRRDPTAHGPKTVRTELYDLEADPGETADVVDAHPDVVARIENHARRARTSLGDALQGVTGNNICPIGRVEHPVTLTTYDPKHPYYLAEYDLTDRG